MKKRVLSLILVVALSLSLCVTASAANYTNDRSGTAKSVIELAKANRECTIDDFGWNADWCAYFVTWIGQTAGANFPTNLGEVGYVRDLARWFVNNNAGTLFYFKEDACKTLGSVSHPERCVKANRYEFTPLEGDIIINYRYGIGWDHTGFVTGYSNGTIYTIEGNTSTAGYDRRLDRDPSAKPRNKYCYTTKVDTKSHNLMNTNYANAWDVPVIMAILRPDYKEAGDNRAKITTPTEGQKGELWELMFNTNVYYNNYGDLRDAFSYNPSALRNHWENYGKAEGRTASALFDANYYLNNNSDVAAAFGRENYWWALWHFVNHGFWEGRQGSPYFCAGTYLNNYGDLRDAFGENQLEAAKHYVTCGIKEGRVASADGNKFNAALLDPPAAQSLPGNPYQYSSAPTRALYYTSRVMTGNDVKWVQAALNLYGNYGLAIDGSFGPATRNATMQFQRSIGGLDVDGSFGPATRAKMISWLASRGYNG